MFSGFKQYRIRTAFACGYLFHIGMNMAHQDYMGREAWIAWADTNWVNLPWWVGGLIALTALLATPIDKGSK